MSNKTIWKFPLEITDVQSVHLPLGANVIHVDQQQAGSLALWAEVDLSLATTEKRTFHVIGTGHPLPPAQLKHVGTVLTEFGFVWHVYEEVDHWCIRPGCDWSWDYD